MFVENGDKDDPMKWDFDETTGYNTITIEDYPYKILKSRSRAKQRLVANKLRELRLLNDVVADEIDNYAEGPGVEIFKYIHKNNKNTSNYLLSEIKPSTGFSGLNKPKRRITTSGEHVGPDKNIRARSRDIFLTIDTKTPDITEDELELFVHELAHTGANHVTWRPDDHKEDFTSFEKLLWEIIDDNFSRNDGN